MENSQDIEIIIQNAPSQMKKMLESVYYFNEDFAKKTKKLKLLEKILFAMSVIDRKFFIPVNEESAYTDNALPIGRGQTISQPSTVARMLLFSEVAENDSVLEIGTGSGWNACLIAFLVYPGQTITIERILELTEVAEKNISVLRENIKDKHPELFQKFSKIKLETKDIFNKSLKCQFDKIIITAGITDKEIEGKIEKIAENLKNKGILICPYTSGPICIYRKKRGKLERKFTNEFFSFVPLLRGIEK